MTRLRATLAGAADEADRGGQGCLSVDGTEIAPSVFEVCENLADRTAFDPHQPRTRAVERGWATGPPMGCDVTLSVA